MIPRIKSIRPLEDYRLELLFESGEKKIYDVKDDIINVPGYHQLQDIPCLFEQAYLDTSRTCVCWNEEIDLPSDMLFEYGVAVNDK